MFAEFLYGSTDCYFLWATLKYGNAEPGTKMPNYWITDIREKLPTKLQKTQKYENLRKMIKIKYKHPNK